MSIDSLFLEDGWLSYLLDESDYLILLESSTEVTATASIFTYGFGLEGSSTKLPTYGFNIPILANSGYLNNNVVSDDYFLYLENHDLILTEDDSRFYTLLLEVDYTRFERRSLGNMGVVITIGTANTSASTITLSNLTCSSFMNRDNTNSGQLSAASTTLASMYTSSLSFQNNFGSVTTTLSSMNGSILLGQLNDNFGFTADKKLHNLTVSARASLIKPNYGSFYNYIY